MKLYIIGITDDEYPPQIHQIGFYKSLKKAQMSLKLAKKAICITSQCPEEDVKIWISKVVTND